MVDHTLTRRHMLTFLSAPVVTAGSGMLTEAEAAAFWNVFGTVDIGGIHFSIGVHSPHVRPYGGYRGYYYRTSHRIKHKKYRCGSYCHRHRGHSYHHESCPLLGYHLARYGAPPAYLGQRYFADDRRYRYDHIYEYDDVDADYYRYGRPHRGRRRGRRRGRGRSRRRW